MQEAEAPAFAFTRAGKTIVDDHRIIDDRVDPVKALCAIRVRNCAEKRYIIVFIVVRKYRNIVSVCKCRAVSPCFNTAEYDAAKDEQRDIEARIEEIEKILKNAEVVVEDEVDSDKINIGCKVDVLDLEYDEEIEFQIVGSTEANSLEGKISNESPVGKALIGAHKDDIVDVETPAGIMQYKVLSIQRNI